MMPSALWYTLAAAAQLPDAGPFVGGPARGVLHTTEGDSYAGALATYKVSGNAPHFTVQGDHVWQHVPLDRAATALKHQPGTVETNRLSCIQIEIVGHAASPTVPPALPPLMRWIEGQLGIAKVAPKFLPYPASSGASTVRFSPSMWLRFGGWCGHQHVPNNDHGDPGAIDVAALFPPTEVRPMYDPPLSVCATLKAPNGGVWGLSPDGGVFAFEGIAPFYGSAAGQTYFAGRRAARLEAHPSGGYTIVATSNERYNYPAS